MAAALRLFHYLDEHSRLHDSSRPDAERPRDDPCKRGSHGFAVRRGGIDRAAGNGLPARPAPRGAGADDRFRPGRRGNLSAICRSLRRRAPYLAAMLIGFGYGAETATIPYLVGRHFGLRSFGEIYSYIFITVPLGGALGRELDGRDVRPHGLLPGGAALVWRRHGGRGPGVAASGPYPVFSKTLPAHEWTYRTYGTHRSYASHMSYS